MTKDYTDEIKARLEASGTIPLASDHFYTCARADIANLLCEREVLRRALKNVAAVRKPHCNNSPCADCDESAQLIFEFCREALAWKPTALDVASSGPEEDV